MLLTGIIIDEPVANLTKKAFAGILKRGFIMKQIVAQFPLKSVIIPQCMMSLWTQPFWLHTFFNLNVHMANFIFESFHL